MCSLGRKSFPVIRRANLEPSTSALDFIIYTTTWRRCAVNVRLPFQSSPPEAPPRCRCRSLDSRLTFVRIPAFRGYVDKFAEKELTPSFPSLESCGRPFTFVWFLSNFRAIPRIVLHLLLPFTPVAHEWGSRCIEEKSQRWTTSRMNSTQFGEFYVRSGNRLVTLGGTFTNLSNHDRNFAEILLFQFVMYDFEATISPRLQCIPTILSRDIWLTFLQLFTRSRNRGGPGFGGCQLNGISLGDNKHLENLGKCACAQGTSEKGGRSCYQDQY